MNGTQFEAIASLPTCLHHEFVDRHSLSSLISQALLHVHILAGTCESRNAGTRNGTRNGTWNGSKIRAARFHHYSPDWTHPKICKMPFQCRTEAKHTYLFTKLACIACFRVFPRVGRGQSSRAYLMSFNEKIRRAFIYRRHRTPAFC